MQLQTKMCVSANFISLVENRFYETITKRLKTFILSRPNSTQYLVSNRRHIAAGNKGNGWNIIKQKM